MRKTTKNQTQPTHNTPLVFFPPPLFSSYPKSFFIAQEPTAFSIPKKHAACERAKQGQSRASKREMVFLQTTFIPLSGSFPSLQTSYFMLLLLLCLAVLARWCKSPFLPCWTQFEGRQTIPPQVMLPHALPQPWPPSLLVSLPPALGFTDHSQAVGNYNIICNG